MPFVAIALLGVSLRVGAQDPSTEERELSSIVDRLDGAEGDVLDAAKKDLLAWVDRLGVRAAPLLKARAEGVGPRLRDLIADELLHLERLEEAVELLAPPTPRVGVFDSLGLPDILGKTWCTYNPGDFATNMSGKGWFIYERGWVLAESESEITLLGDNLVTKTIERRYALPQDWDRYKDQQPSDMPLPGMYVAQPFDEYCSRFLLQGVPQGFEGFSYWGNGGLGHGVDCMLYAWWSLALGHARNAVGLVALGRRSIADWKEHHLGGQEPVEEFLVTAIARNLRWQAIRAAGDGEGRTDLLSRWKRIAALPRHEWTDEAETMVRLYKEEIAEDSKRAPRTPEELASMPPKARVEHWFHALRDHDARQMCQPGAVDLFYGVWGEKPNAVQELVNLGWDALPVVIEHMDDPHPTRSYGFHRHFSIGSFYLVDVGRCCWEVFRYITGIGLYAGDEREVDKAFAAQWWKENGEKGPGDYFLEVLDGPDESRHPMAMLQLLRADRDKHIGRVMDVMRRPGYRPREWALREIAPFLDKEHEEFLRGFLQGSSRGALLAAARVLWEKCGSDEGARVLAWRLGFPQDANESPASCVDEGLEFLATTGLRDAIDLQTRLLGSKNRDVMKEALRTAHLYPDRGVAEALVRLLDDRGDSGAWCVFKLRWCDQASQALSRMLEGAGAPKAATASAERDARVEEMRTWWQKNADRIDWERLRR